MLLLSQHFPCIFSGQIPEDGVKRFYKVYFLDKSFSVCYLDFYHTSL